MLKSIRNEIYEHEKMVKEIIAIIHIQYPMEFEYRERNTKQLELFNKFEIPF